ncbi:MAG: hypothetical protein KDA27_25195, partial [Candidatus Eisenbacteria bacterium]|nr:hypothetical protein [Candidatus Eisenbacteria bacterium]
MHGVRSGASRDSLQTRWLASITAIAMFASTMIGCAHGKGSFTEPLPEPTSRGIALSEVDMVQQVQLDQPLSANALAAIAVLTNPDLQVTRAEENVA